MLSAMGGLETVISEDQATIYIYIVFVNKTGRNRKGVVDKWCKWMGQGGQDAKFQAQSQTQQPWTSTECSRISRCPCFHWYLEKTTHSNKVFPALEHRPNHCSNWVPSVFRWWPKSKRVNVLPTSDLSNWNLSQILIGNIQKQIAKIRSCARLLGFLFACSGGKLSRSAGLDGSKTIQQVFSWGLLTIGHPKYSKKIVIYSSLSMTCYLFLKLSRC